MISKKAIVLLIGTALLSAILAGACAQSQGVLPRAFFINPETGQPTVKIIVGEKAAEMDIISATMLSTKIWSMADPEGLDVAYIKTYKSTHTNIDPFLMNQVSDEDVKIKGKTSIKGLGFPTIDVPDAQAYAHHDFCTHNINYGLSSLWYLDDPHGYWGNNDGDFQPWETHEEIQIRFDDFSHIDSTFNCAAGVNGGTIPPGTPFGLTTWNWYHIPGVIYRVDNIFAPPTVSIPVKDTPYGSVSAKLFPYRIPFAPEPWMIFQDCLPQFKFFDTVYTVVDAGPILDIEPFSGRTGSLHGTPYIITGEPHIESRVHLYVNEPFNYSNYTIELRDVDEDHNTAYLDIFIDSILLESFSLVIDPQNINLPGVEDENFLFTAYKNCKDLNDNGKLDPGEMSHTIVYDYDSDGVPDYHKWVMERVELDTWVTLTWWYYTNDALGACYLFNFVDTYVEGVGILPGDPEGIIINVYWLKNPKGWYNKICSDPWTTDPDYQMVLDAYESGWDSNGTCYLYQPPGTGLWPPAGLNQWTDSSSEAFIGNGFLDSNDGHSGYECSYLAGIPAYFPEQNDFDKDGGTTNDCRYSDYSREESCRDLYDIEDPVVWHGPGQIIVEINVGLCKTKLPKETGELIITGPYFEDLSYFSIQTTDTLFTCKDGDGIDYDITIEVTTIEVTDENFLVILDSEFDFGEWKSSCQYNLICVGGPVANAVVNQLVDEGLSTVDWVTSPGELEYIKTPYNTCDILIIAGGDRDCTRDAVDKLIDQL